MKVKPDKNDELMECIIAHDSKAVHRLLKNGADPNCSRGRDNKEVDGSQRPTTPLQMVVFLISDAHHQEHHLKQFAQIAKLLVQFGADPRPARYMAESRYGTYDPQSPKSPFRDVRKIIEDAKWGQEK